MSIYTDQYNYDSSSLGASPMGGYAAYRQMLRESRKKCKRHAPGQKCWCQRVAYMRSRLVNLGTVVKISAGLIMLVSLCGLLKG